VHLASDAVHCAGYQDGKMKVAHEANDGEFCVFLLFGCVARELPVCPLGTVKL
jgi:hypothetical protein